MHYNIWHVSKCSSLHTAMEGILKIYDGTTARFVQNKSCFKLIIIIIVLFKYMKAPQYVCCLRRNGYETDTLMMKTVLVTLLLLSTILQKHV